MKLRTVEITDFQSIRQSNPFNIGDITCLVGKNESGKTAILQALYRLNPIIPSEGKYDVVDDYPRSNVEDYQQDVDNGTKEPAIVAKATFALDTDDLEEIVKDFGEGLLFEPELTLSKGYENVIRIGLQIDAKIAINSLIKNAQLPGELAVGFSECSTIDALESVAKSILKEENKEHINRLLSAIAKINEKKGLILYFYKTYLEGSVPKFLYFDEYYMMRGHENLESLKKRIEEKKTRKSDYPLLGLIELARLKIDELFNPTRTEWLINKLEGAGNHLSRKILRYWSQNKHLQMKFDVRPGRQGDPEGMQSGTNIWARVYDSKHLVTTPLGTRSRGFIWFFSFLSWFDQQQRKNERLILLLDEPGLFLHGRAQEDLLCYMEEELKENHQVIYTTHSPFMVDPKRLDRVRIVQDKSMDADKELPQGEDGTKVLSDVLEATEDSLFPLQGALGYEIHQSLFIGPYSLVVEGVSDLLYLQTISSVLDEQGREGLNSKWTITPVGGANKVPTFIALIGAQKGIMVATLIDIQKRDLPMIENLYKRKLLKKQNVLTYGDFTGTPEADIEDMFGPEFYLVLVNDEYVSALENQITEDMLTSRAPRILIRLEEYFKNSPLKKGGKFSHYRPARFFFEKITDLKTNIPPETLNRFETAFKTLNSLL